MTLLVLLHFFFTTMLWLQTPQTEDDSFENRWYFPENKEKKKLRGRGVGEGSGQRGDTSCEATENLTLKKA